MLAFKSRIVWVATLAMILLPLLVACGGTETPTAVPTDTPAAAAPTETTAAMPAATDTPATTVMTPTAAMGTTDKMAALATEGIKPDPNAKGKFEFFSW